MPTRTDNMTTRNSVSRGGDSSSTENATPFVSAFNYNSQLDRNSKLAIRSNAGNKPLDHYKRNMSSFRYWLRTKMLPTVRAETQPLANFQARFRTPWLDQYFALTANLGTHTFYMIMLPTLIWFNNYETSLEMIWQLALGVYFTGFIKDYLCLPRPLSPPVHRISMSGSAVLEYGFPSTHSCNAVSVALLFASVSSSWQSHAANSVLVASIVVGRLYNGMHGWLDVVSGILSGIFVFLCRYVSASWVDSHFGIGQSFVGAAVFFVVIVTAIISHPQPVDNCPCFDDTVAFLSVLAGIYLGMQWSFSKGIDTFENAKFDFATAGYLGIVVRFVVGVLMIVGWRAVAKTVLLQGLPPLYRTLQTIGLDLPRRFFLSASNYKEVPADISDELLPESPKQIASMIRDVRKSRGRNDSVGPQSAADVYEAIARAQTNEDKPSKSGTKSESDPLGLELSPEDEQELMATAHVHPPRARYDVEVVTKIIVYAGIPIMVNTLCIDVFHLLNV